MDERNKKNGDGNNVINLTPIIINRSYSKHCQCKNPSYEVDINNREVRCQECGNYIDPIDAMYNLALHWEFILKWEREHEEAIKELENYKPWKRAMKDIEKAVGRKGDMLPQCPHCGRGFHLEEVRGFVSPEICKNHGWANKKEPD